MFSGLDFEESYSFWDWELRNIGMGLEVLETPLTRFLNSLNLNYKTDFLENKLSIILKTKRINGNFH